MNADLGWVKPFGDAESDAVYEVAVDSEDNVYAVSTFAGSVDLDPDASYPDNRDLVSVPLTGYGLAYTKFDADGNLLWSHVAVGQDGSLSGTQSSVPRGIQVHGNSVYAFGSLNDLWDFDPNNPGSDSQRDQFDRGVGSYLLKLDANTGDFRWVNGFGLSASGPVRGDSLAVAPDGTSFLSVSLREGATIGSQTVPAQPSSYSSGILQIAADGEVLGYQQLVGSAYLNTPALELVTPTSDPASWRLYVAGGFEGELSLNGDTIANQNSGDIDAFLVSLGMDFQVENFTQYNYPANQYPDFLSANDSGLHLAGDLNIVASDGSSPIGDDFVMRLDFEGNVLASQAFGDDNSTVVFNSIQATEDGVLVGGYFVNTVDFGGEVLTSFDGSSDGFVLKLDPQLNTEWVRQFSSTNSNYIRDVDANSQGHVVLGGSFRESATIPVVGGVTSAGVTDGYLALIAIDDSPGSNSAPVSSDDLYTLASRELQISAEEGLLVNDFDPDGDNVSIELLTPPSNGSLQLNQDGSFTYSPTPGFLGTDQFIYRTSDGELTSDPATVTLEVLDEVVFFEDSFEEGTWNGKWFEDSQNDWFRSTQRATDGNYSAEVDGWAFGATLTVSQPIDLSGVSEATLSFDWLIERGFDSGEAILVEFYENGSWISQASLWGNEDPENVWVQQNIQLKARHLTEDFQFRFIAYVSSSSEDANVDNVKLVGLVKNDSNAPPVAGNDAVSTAEDQAVLIDVLGNDNDPEGDAITVTSVTQPSSGLAVIVGGQVSYLPDADFNGGDSFAYTIADSLGQTATATVDVTVTPVNDAPVAEDQSVFVKQNTVKILSLTANDVDEDSLTFSIQAGPSFGTLSGTAPNLNYTPNPGYSGSDSFSFLANDGNLNSNLATVTITIAANQAPSANSQSLSLDEDSSLALALSGSDPDGDPLNYELLSQPANGSLSGTAPNLTYTPDVNFNGSDSFTFKVNDGTDESGVATVAITVSPINDAPVADSQSVSTAEDTALSVSLSGSDLDGDTLSFIIVAGPTNGTLSGSGANLTYTPAGDFNGLDSFAFQVNDGTLDSAVATVSIGVTPVNDAPVANADSYAVDQDGTLSVAASGVLANDIDSDGDALSAVAWTGNSAQGGQVILNSDGTFSYTPPAGYAGIDSFDYSATDGSLQSSLATVMIEVVEANQNAIYVADIRFESRYWGWQRRAVFQIRSDSNFDGQGGGSDQVAAGVEITVSFGGQTFTGVTDSSGTFRTGWVWNPGSGSYANVIDMAFADYAWDPLALDLEDDSDGDGRPDARL